MQKEDKIYELIAKELTSDNGKEESEELQQMLAENYKLSILYRKLNNFWINYFTTNKSRHNIIEITEKKLDFTYQVESQKRFGIMYRITASFF